MMEPSAPIRPISTVYVPPASTESGICHFPSIETVVVATGLPFSVTSTNEPGSPVPVNRVSPVCRRSVSVSWSIWRDEVTGSSVGAVGDGVATSTFAGVEVGTGIAAEVAVARTVTDAEAVTDTSVSCGDVGVTVGNRPVSPTSPGVAANSGGSSDSTDPALSGSIVSGSCSPTSGAIDGVTAAVATDVESAGISSV